MLSKNNIKLGIAPIAWTNDDMPWLGEENSFEQCISEAALAGYAGTEVGNKYPKDPIVLKKYLDIRSLTIASKWFSSFLVTKSFEENKVEFEKELDYLTKVGCNRINVCEVSYNIIGEKITMFKNKPTLTDDEWEKLTSGLNKLGKIAKDKGFKLCFHHHMATVVQTLLETKRLMDNTDKDLVYLCFDSGHFTLSQEDSVEAIKMFANRIGHVHFKDIRKNQMEKAITEQWNFQKAVVEGCFTVPGDGCIDFDSIIGTLKEVGYEGWIVVEAEQNPAIANPFEYALMARKYIKEHAGL